MLFVTRREAAPVLELAEAPLDNIPTSVALSIDRDFTLAITTGGDDRSDTSLAQPLAYLIVVVSFIAGKMDGAQPRTSARDALDFAHVHESHEVRCIVFFTSGYREHNRVSVPISSKMYFRTEATAAASEARGALFFHRLHAGGPESRCCRHNACPNQ